MLMRRVISHGRQRLIGFSAFAPDSVKHLLSITVSGAPFCHEGARRMDWKWFCQEAFELLCSSFHQPLPWCVVVNWLSLWTLPSKEWSSRWMLATVSSRQGEAAQERSLRY